MYNNSYIMKDFHGKLIILKSNYMHKFSRQYSLPLVFTIYHFSTFFWAIKELFSQYTKIFTNKTKFEKFFFLIFLLSVLLKLFLNGVDKKSIIFICTFNTIFR